MIHMFKTFVRSALLTGLLTFAPAIAALGQEGTVASAEAVADLFDKLAQLQDANLGIARQIADTQERAASGLQDVLAAGLVPEAPLQGIAKTFIDNALTLASIMLTPMATQDVTAGGSFVRLLRSNISMLEGIRAAARKNADLAGALEKYSVLQSQSEDLAVALSNGWTRYGDAIRTAQVTGIIRPGAFDAVAKTWTLASPDGTIAVAAAEATNDTPPAIVPEPALTGTPRSPDASAAPIVEARTEPQPGLTLPVAREELVLQPEEAIIPEPVVATEPVPAPQVDATSDGRRLAPTGPLDVAEFKDGAGKIGDWSIKPDGKGLLMASADNINLKTIDRIGGMTIACGENGTLVYLIDASTSYTSYSIYSDDAITRTVLAENNAISGRESAAMADTMRLAFDWAEADPDKRRRITVAAADDEEVPAQFSPEGYMEARGKVLDACVQSLVDRAMGTAAAGAGEAPREAAIVVPEGAVIKPDLVAPIPRTRPKTFKKAEAKAGPVDLVSGN